MTRVLIVDDDLLMRAGLTELLAVDPSLEIVGQAATGREAIQQTQRHSPDVIVMDIRMPDMDGIAATRQLAQIAPDSRVLVLTTFDHDDYLFDALSAGASGFLLKRSRPEDLIAAVHTIASGDALLSPAVTRRVIDSIERRRRPDHVDEALATLTPREREVLALIARGLNNREIGEMLFVEESTVRTHVKRILMKLGARDRIHAVIYAYECGLAGGTPANGERRSR
jgi:RNA polymerase sigma factor (sigma-70 family)